MKNKLYYVVEKQLDDIDDIGTTNGLKNICLYEIKNDNIEEILYLKDIDNNNSSIETLKEFIDEFVSEYDTDKIEFVKL